GRWKIVEGAVEKQRTSAGLGHGKDERCTRRLAVLVRKLRKSRHPGIALDRKPPGGAPADGLPLSVGQGGEELRGALAQRPEQGRTIAAREARRGVDELGGGIRPLLLAAQPAPDLVDLSLNFTGAAEAARGEAGHLLLPRLDLAGEPGLRLGRLADLVPRFDRLPRRRRTPSRLVGFARRLQPGAELLHRFRPGGGEELLYPPTLAGEAPLELCQPFLEKAPATRGLLALLTRGDRAEKDRGRDAEGGDGEDGQSL